jgi:hypothetical protein
VTSLALLWAPRSWRHSREERHRDTMSHRRAWGLSPFRGSRHAVFTNFAKSSGTQVGAAAPPAEVRCWRSIDLESSPTVTTMKASLFCSNTKPCWPPRSCSRTKLPSLTSGKPRPLNHWNAWRRSLTVVGRVCGGQASIWHVTTRHAAHAEINRRADRSEQSMRYPSPNFRRTGLK